MNDSISVVIPIEGRVTLLERLLVSLRNSEPPPNVQVEVIVVDSSPDMAAKGIQEICERHRARYRRGPRNVRAKRNLGAGIARHNWLLFLDSDCVVSAGLLKEYGQKILETSKTGFKAGAGPTVFRGDETWFTRLISDSELLSPFSKPKRKGELLLWSTTSNLLLSKEIFLEENGFREDLPFRLGGDDMDLGLRLNRRKVPIIGIPDAVCFHSWRTWSDPLDVMRRSFRWGFMNAIMINEHREYRRIAEPGFVAFVLGVVIIALIAGVLGADQSLWFVPCFLLLSPAIHALIAGLIPRPMSLMRVVKDVMCAVVELPFGFGKLAGCMVCGSVAGMSYRIAADDQDADLYFATMVPDLWANILSLFATFFILG